MHNSDRNHSVVWRLLRRNISAAHIAGYLIAGFIGMAIVVTGIQFYCDVNSCDSDNGGGDALLSRDYLVLSKRVEGLGSLGGSQASFTDDEIEALSNQPWAGNVGRFTASDFNVSASVEMGGRTMGTYLFFESIPDEFFDVKPDGWDFDPADPFVPVVLSKDYLALYNFGFAASRGLPQLSEAMIGMVPLRVSISGNGRQQWLPARIVGFSSRLNTIAVPQQFMDWANARFGEGGSSGTSRLIVEVTSPGDPQITSYLDANGLESAGDKVASGRTAYFLSVITGVVIAVGLVITVLAFFILLLSIYLLLQKNRTRLRDLMLLGYEPRDVARYYYIMVIVVNAAVAILSIAAMFIARISWAAPLDSIGLHGSSPWTAIVVAVAIATIVTALDIVAIRRRIVRTWYGY